MRGAAPFLGLAAAMLACGAVASRARAADRRRAVVATALAGGRDLHGAAPARTRALAPGATKLLPAIAVLGACVAAGLGGARALAAVAVVAPVVVIRGVLARRRAELVRRRSLEEAAPELVELVVAAMRAGAGLHVALSRAAEVMAPPLGDELRTAVAQVGLGMPWSGALSGLAERSAAPSLRRLTVTIERSDRLGAPLTSALGSLADELRAERRARAEERARRAPVQMLFPLVFLILPAFLLLTVGPVLLGTLRSLR